MSIWDNTAIFMRDANAQIKIDVADPVPCYREVYEEVTQPTENEGGIIGKIIAVTLPTAQTGNLQIGDTVQLDGEDRVVRQRRKIQDDMFTHLLLELP